MRLKSTITYILLIATLSIACRSRYLPNVDHSELIHFDSSTVLADDQIEALISPYRHELNKSMNDTIGYLKEAMVKARPEGKLGNLCARMLFDYAVTVDKNIDLVLLNHGGLRAPLSKGAITRSKIYELMPFDNELVILQLPIEHLDNLANAIAAKGGDPIWTRSPVFLKIQNGQGSFENMGTNNPYITIATSDYLANGGDSYSVLSRATSRNSTTVLIREIFLQEISKSSSEEPLESYIEGKVQVVKP